MPNFKTKAQRAKARAAPKQWDAQPLCPLSRKKKNEKDKAIEQVKSHEPPERVGDPLRFQRQIRAILLSVCIINAPC